jgi:nucleoid-associated protein YgaU
MPSRQNIFFLLSLLAALALGAGCSSSQTAGDDGYLDMGNSPESGADAVGSIPEDMLANDEAATEATTEGDSAATDTAASEAPAGSDPFADLAESEGAKDALEVTEEEGTATTGSTEKYSVKAGDTLMKIAFTIYGDIDRWKDLRDWNQAAIKNASHLKVGTKLTYETPLQPFNAQELSHSYLIKQGDTLAGIADEVYGRKMKYRKLQRYNQKLIKNPNRIFAGFTIFYDITDKELAEAEARRQERMAGGGGGFPAPPPSSGGDDFNLLGGGDHSAPAVPSALSPPKPASSGSAPVAAFPSSGAAPIAPPGSVQPIAPPGH